MTRLLVTLWAALCLAAPAIAATITGTVSDANGQPLPFANVIAYQGETLVKGTVTDTDGAFTLQGLKTGSYTISFQMMGYQTATRPAKLNSASAQVDLGAVSLSEERHEVQEVAVVAQKSQIKLDIDKKVFSVDQNIASVGGSASDVLENIPSVEVDSEGNVSLRGSSSVTVWINGKAQGLTSDNRGDILQQLPGESIDHVEVITNPSSKYSPEGSAGIINIVLKRDRKAGYYGGVQLSVNSEKGGRLGGNINYSGPVIEAYLNVGYGRRVHKSGGWTNRDYMSGQTPTGYLNSTNDGEGTGNHFFLRGGLTWHMTAHDEISAGYMGMLGNGDRNTDYRYTSGNYYGFNTLESFWRTRESDNSDDMTMNNVDFSYRHEWATSHFIEAYVSRHAWDMDGDTYYDQRTYYYNDLPYMDVWPQETLDSAAVKSYQSQKTNIKTSGVETRLDYERPVGETGKLETGYEGDFSRENSPTETYADQARTQSIKSLFNRFKYDMDVNALYANWSHRPGNKLFGYQLGLRAEWWQVRTSSYSYDQEYNGVAPDKFKKNYYGLFPTAYLSFKLPADQELQLNYTRRLRRPWGGEMNSFKNISDSTSISYGNPKLTPEYTNSLELNYIKMWDNHTISFSAYYRPSTDVIQSIAYMDNGVRYSTNQNIARSQRSGVELIGKNKLWTRLDLTTTLNLYYYTLDGGTFTMTTDAGNKVDVLVHDDSDFTWNIREMASLMLPAELTCQATFNYDAPTVISQGTRKASYSLDMGLRKTLLDRKLTLALNGRDILDSRARKSSTSAEGFRQESYGWWGGRRLIFQVSYSFGNMKAKAKPGRQADVSSGYGDNGGGDD